MDQDMGDVRKAEKRSASEELPKGVGSKQQRIGDGPLDSLELMEALEEMEEKTGHITTTGRHMPMVVCEESLDISYLEAT